MSGSLTTKGLSMGMIAECDLCKTARAEEMEILEIKLFSSNGQPREVLGAMICPECLHALGYGDFLHRFKSAGAVDVVAQQLRQQRAQALNAPLDQPVPIDPKLAHRIRNAR